MTSIIIIALAYLYAPSWGGVIDPAEFANRYYFIPRKLYFSRAQDYCKENFDTQVTVPHCKAENDAMNLIATSYPEGPEYWIGVYRRHLHWYARDVRAMAYIENPNVLITPWHWFRIFSLWNEGEPNYYNRYETCVMVTSNGLWKDVVCSVEYELPFFCYRPQTVIIPPTNQTYQGAQAFCESFSTPSTVVQVFTPRSYPDIDLMYLKLKDSLGTGEKIGIGTSRPVTTGAFMDKAGREQCFYVPDQYEVVVRQRKAGCVFYNTRYKRMYVEDCDQEVMYLCESVKKRTKSPTKKPTRVPTDKPTKKVIEKTKKPTYKPSFKPTGWPTRDTGKMEQAAADQRSAVIVMAVAITLTILFIACVVIAIAVVFKICKVEQMKKLHAFNPALGG